MGGLFLCQSSCFRHNLEVAELEQVQAWACLGEVRLALMQNARLLTTWA